MSAKIEFDMTDFNRQVEQVRQLIGRNGRSYVRTTARRLIRRLAWNAPKASQIFLAAGRLRAGFWPAAAALNITNIYTNQPNKNEGDAIDRTDDPNPSFQITNSVPYVGTLKQGLAWAENAQRGVEAQMIKDLRKYADDTWARRDLIEDLSGD